MTEPPISQTPAAPHPPAAVTQQRTGVVNWAVRLTALVLAILLTVNLVLLTSQLRTISQGSRERAFWDLCRPGITAQQRTEYFLRLVAEGNTVWKGAILGNLDLRGADFSGAQIESAVFSSCDFVEANFTNAVLNRSGLDASDLSRARFADAEVRNATFFQSILTEADFRGAELLSTSFEQARAEDAIFVSAKMGDAFLAMANVTRADFTAADLSGANLEAAILKNCDLALANLYDTKLADTDFTDSNWWRARGLSSEQLNDLTLRFAPGPNAPESRQRDFEIWLSKRLEEMGTER